MSKSQVNPTRMELLNLKNKLTMSRRGHKLLKDKQDELVHTFVAMVYETRDLRTEVDQYFSNVLGSFKIIKKKMAMVDIYEMLMVPNNNFEVSYSARSLMSIELPKVAYKHIETNGGQTYSDITSPLEINLVERQMIELLPDLISLMEMEQKIYLMTEEIAKTRRRVNVIEHIMIPELEEEIKRISMKLEDNERSNKVRTMKSKEIVIENVRLEREKRNKNVE